MDLILDGILTVGFIVFTFTMLVYGKFNPVGERLSKRQIEKLKKQYTNLR